MKSRGYWIVLASSFAALGGLCFERISRESQYAFNAGLDKGFRGTKYDPRGYDLVDSIVKKRESESFRDRLRKGTSSDLSWPGLASAQVSWTWLELLQGLHSDSSFQGDFSWMFSKLNTVIQNSPKREQRFVTALGAFYYVIGRDPAGATLLMQEMIKRSPDIYHTWFWDGYHAYYNLGSPLMASYFFERAARFPNTAPYLAVLSWRLKNNVGLMTKEERRNLIEKELDSDLIEKAKKARPDWFE